MLQQAFALCWLAAALTLGSNAQIPLSSEAAELKCAATGLPAPPQKILNDVRTTYVRVPNSPYEAAYATRQKHTAFVSLAHELGNSTLGVLDTSAFAPKLVHQIPLPAGYINYEGALGVTVSTDGRHVFVAAGQGAVIVDAAKAAMGRPDSVVGTLNGTTASQGNGNGSIEVAVSPDDRYAFVSQEHGEMQVRNGELYGIDGNIDVFKLKQHRDGRVTGRAIGFLTLGISPVKAVLSPDACTMYVTSEQIAPNVFNGSITVIDVKTLEHHPSKALIANVTVGCGAARMILSSDGKTAWVTARYSNLLQAFDVSKFASDPDYALLASVTVGTSPVGLTFARNETRILTADAARFSKNGTTGLSVVDVEAALAGREGSVLGSVPTGLFPRNFATSADGKTILVADYTSGQIQAVDVETLP